jgi:hypothetical protein
MIEGIPTGKGGTVPTTGGGEPRLRFSGLAYKPYTSKKADRAANSKTRPIKKTTRHPINRRPPPPPTQEKERDEEKPQQQPRNKNG